MLKRTSKDSTVENNLLKTCKELREENVQLLNRIEQMSKASLSQGIGTKDAAKLNDPELQIQELVKELDKSGRIIKDQNVFIARVTTDNEVLESKLKEVTGQVEVLNRKGLEDTNELNSQKNKYTALINVKNDQIEKLTADNQILQAQAQSITSDISMANAVMAKIQDLHIKQEFIEGNYQLIVTMVGTVNIYIKTLKEALALEQEIFVLESQAFDNATLFRASKKSDDLHSQRLCESHAKGCTNNLTEVKAKLKLQEDELLTLVIYTDRTCNKR
jgi:hypothetical protein